MPATTPDLERPTPDHEGRLASAPRGPTQPSRPAAFAGVLGGLIGATCCVGPAVGVAVGAGSGSFLLAIGDYRFHVFALGGLVAFGLAAMLFVRRRRECPTEPERRALRSRWVDVAILAFGVTYVLGRVVVPRLIAALTS